MTNKKKRAARQCAVLLAVLSTLSGCSTVKMMTGPRSELWLATRGIDKQSYYEGLDLDPVSTMSLGGGTYNVLKWRGTEVMEIPCRRMWPDTALHLHSRMDNFARADAGLDAPLTEEEIVDIYTLDACTNNAVNLCAWIMHDTDATFRLYGRLIWHGGRHRGPALYVQCITGAELRDVVLSKLITNEVEPWTGRAWRRYIRRLLVEETKKDSEN